MRAPRPTILILAAGASSRMQGRDKLMEALPDGAPLLTARAMAALATRCPVLVALPPDSERPARWAALDELTLGRITVRDAGAGMSASIRAGVAALRGDAPGLMILPADMPEITTEDMTALLGAFDGDTILRGACGATPGHPVLFPARDFPALAEVSGDEGARAVLAANPDRLRLVALPEAHAVTDLDTPEDWADWRAKNAR